MKTYLAALALAAAALSSGCSIGGGSIAVNPFSPSLPGDDAAERAAVAAAYSDAPHGAPTVGVATVALSQ